MSVEQIGRRGRAPWSGLGRRLVGPWVEAHLRTGLRNRVATTRHDAAISVVLVAAFVAVARVAASVAHVAEPLW